MYFLPLDDATLASGTKGARSALLTSNDCEGSGSRPYAEGGGGGGGGGEDRRSCLEEASRRDSCRGGVAAVAGASAPLGKRPPTDAKEATVSTFNKIMAMGVTHLSTPSLGILDYR